jgi:hypothetical protein
MMPVQVRADLFLGLLYDASPDQVDAYERGDRPRDEGYDHEAYHQSCAQSHGHAESSKVGNILHGPCGTSTKCLPAARQPCVSKGDAGISEMSGIGDLAKTVTSVCGRLSDGAVPYVLRRFMLTRRLGCI